jgi:hypothetical protein
MSSHLKTNLVSPANGTTTTLGESGDTIQLGTGATAIGFGEGGVPSDVKTFVNSGTWTKPAGCVAVVVEVQGGGSSGNRSGTNGLYNAGAGGGYAKKLIDVSSISTAAITVGAGGAELNSNGYGKAGGTSSWDDGTNTLTCTGGAAGGDFSNVQTLGGTGTGGDINISGQAGGTQITGGGGGDSHLGSGGRKGRTNEPTSPPVGYGAGAASSENVYGAAGADGVVIVTEYSGTSGSSGGGGSSSESPVKAWVNFNGTGTVAIEDSMNVSSITDNGTGDYTINFTVAMDNDNYAFFGSSANTDNSAGDSTTNRGYFMDLKQPDSKSNVKTTSSINVVTFQLAPDRYRTPVDFKENSLVIVGS